MQELTDAVAALDKAAYTVAGTPDHHKLSIHMKSFHTPKDPADPKGIFNEAAAIIERLKDAAPYHTDGLIFTPNAAPLPKNGQKWFAQLKWKPAHMNSVDFLVRIEKERGVDKKPTRTEWIEPRWREDSQQMVRCKTLRLFVGSSTHPVFEKARDTVLNEKPLPSFAELDAEYRPVEFSPQPPDPMGAICYVAINGGATDAAGAAPEASALASLDDNIYCEETKDPITDNTVVEMVYDPKKPAGWRWKPMRVRWDKTEMFRRREVLGSLNAETTANDVWVSIHNPVTEKMICTGAVTDDTPVVGQAAGTVTYYQRKANQRDLLKVSNMLDFHNQYIKKMLISRALKKKGSAFLDMSVGQAGDIHRWVDMNVGWVLGCDIAESGLTDSKNGAYRRYIDKIIKKRTRDPIPPMVFIQADSSQRYADGSAGQTPEDRIMLRALWGESEPTAPPAIKRLAGKAALGFDAASLMFSLHYFFKDRGTLDGMLRNLAETVKVGGMFVGCCFDGDAVASFLSDIGVGETKRGNEGGTDIWTITKQYDDDSTIVPPTDAGLGRAISVSFISIGEAYTEYLVSFPYLHERMKEIGFELLNDEELGEMGLYHSTSMFADMHAIAAKVGLNYMMSPVVQTFSFLNRMFLFRRRRAVGMAAPAPTRAVAAAAAAAAEEAASNAEVAEENNAASETAETGVNEAEENEEAEEAEENNGENLTVADGPIYTFNNRGTKAKREELKALGIKDKFWRRYISTNTPFAFKDIKNPAIVYPSFEAAIAAAKYQRATNKPDLGAQLFSVTGNIHQAAEAAERAKGDTINDDDRAEIADNEATAIKEATKPAAIRKTGAKFNAEAWADAREEVIVEYVRQRFEGDEHFAEILAALAAQNARLVFSGAASELTGSVKDEEISGDNLYGRALMRVVGLTY